MSDDATAETTADKTENTRIEKISRRDRDSTKEPPSWNYVYDLRDESQHHRTKNKELETKVKQFEEMIDKLTSDGRAAVKAVEEKWKGELKVAKEASEAAIHSSTIKHALRIAALKGGMTDVNDLALADTSSLKVDDKGEVVGADELVVKLREAKPYLFGAAAVGTSSPADVPDNKGTAPPDARTMTVEQRKVALDKLRRAST